MQTFRFVLRYFASLSVLLLFWSGAVFPQSIQMAGLSGPNAKQERTLTFSSNSLIKYNFFPLKSPPRLVFDIKQADQLSRQISLSAFANSPIKDVRSAQRDKGLRVVVDLKRPTGVRIVSLAPENGHPYRLVITFIPSHSNSGAKQAATAKAPVAHQSVPKPAAVSQVTAETASVVTKVPSKASERPIIIVIDPGHGGKDPGATGRHGTREKNVVLAISKHLKYLLNQKPGFKAVLTRDTDRFIPLRQRLEIARQYKADMFIAVHADAFRKPSAHGASVYALSARGATSEAARWIAERENQSELMGGVVLDNKNNVLKSVLINLSQNASIRTSLRIGQSLLESMHRVTRLHYSHVEQAAFVVLKSPDIPSLLVETGFLSNVTEERHLRDPIYQHSIANALSNGISSFFIRNPPPGTWLASHHSKSSYYLVKRGDTMSSIAVRYGMSVKQLMSKNHLHSSKLYVGQKLVI